MFETRNALPMNLGATHYVDGNSSYTPKSIVEGVYDGSRQRSQYFAKNDSFSCFENFLANNGCETSAANILYSLCSDGAYIYLFGGRNRNSVFKPRFLFVANLFHEILYHSIVDESLYSSSKRLEKASDSISSIIRSFDKISRRYIDSKHKFEQQNEGFKHENMHLTDMDVLHILSIEEE